MANRFTQITQTPYVSQYTPAPTNQFAQLAKQSRDRFEQAKLQDAETRALAMRTLGTASTPEERQKVEKIVRPAIEDLDRRAREGNYHDALLEAKTQGLETASRIQSLKDARSRKQQMIDKFREVNKDVSPEVVDFYAQNMAPSLQFDEETRYVGLEDQELPGNLAKDVNLSEAVDKGLKGTKAREILGEGYRLDENLGVIVNQKGEAITGDRARNIASLALEGNAEVQNYLDRQEGYYADRARQTIEQGGSPLRELITAYDSTGQGEIADEVRTKANNMLENGYSEAEVYGRLMRNQELSNALGYGETKYAYRDVDTSLRNPSSMFKEQLSRETNQRLAQSRGTNNIYSTSMPDQVDVDTVLDIGDIDEGYVREATMNDPRSRAMVKSGERQKRRRQIEEKDLNELFRSESVKEKYGNTLADLSDKFPQKEGEDNEEYLDRINSKYQEQKQVLDSMRGFYNEYSDKETIEDTNTLLFGDDDSARSGTAINKGFYETTAGKESGTEPMNVNQVADRLGYGSTPEGIEEMFNRATALGKFEGGDPTVASGYEVVIPSKDTRWFGNNAQTRTFRVSENNIQNEARLSDIRELSEVKFNPKKDSTDPFNLRIAGNSYNVTAKAQSVYRDPETGEETTDPDENDVFIDRRLYFEDEEGNQYIEGDRTYQQIYNKLASN